MGNGIFSESDEERERRGAKPAGLRTVLIGPHRLRGDAHSRRVWLNEVELNPEDANAVCNHSPDGFAYGYCGSGPACLALAVCLKIIPLDAHKNYQVFKEKIVAAIKFHSHFDIEFVFDREVGWAITNVFKMEEVPHRIE